MPVVNDETQETLGFLREPLIHPDTGRIEGFFVTPAFPLMDGGKELFLSAPDVLGWGTKVHVRSSDRLSPPGELIRLQALLSDQRRFLGQPVLIHGTKRRLGACSDVQFDTRHFTVEWLFPRRLFFLRQPIPASEIVEVTPRGIWVRDPLLPVREETVIREEKERGIVLPDVVPVPQGSQSAFAPVGASADEELGCRRTVRESGACSGVHTSDRNI